MSRRLQMLQVARLAQRTLGEATGLVANYLENLVLSDGSYANRDGKADLYYTSFALDALAAVDRLPNEHHQPEIAHRTRHWLSTFGDGESLDFVHRCCLARAWASQPASVQPSGLAEALAVRIADNCSADGGYATRSGASRGTAYGCFLALNALEDLGVPVHATPQRQAISDSLHQLRSDDGGWANAPGQPLGSTTATAAAIATLCSLELTVPTEAGAFLLAQQHPTGGFLATPDTPLPDLLSTAVALHALDAVDVNWRKQQDLVLDYLDSLWSAEGGFHGSWADDVIDAEYTYYGLVALGHASV
ncbi:MAG: prenyltransferase/squalene oxidase repeat-containing protein [Pirellulales bacterium]